MFVTYPRWSWCPSVPDADRAVATTAHPHVPDDREPKPASIATQVPDAVKMAVRNHDVRSHHNGSGWQTTNCACCGRDIKSALRSRTRDRHSEGGGGDLSEMKRREAERRPDDPFGRLVEQVKELRVLGRNPGKTHRPISLIVVADDEANVALAADSRRRISLSYGTERADLLRARELRNKSSRVFRFRCQFFRDWHWPSIPLIAKIR